MANGVTISGLDECLKWLDDMPDKCQKAARTAMRDTGREVSKRIRARAPKRFRRLVKAKVTKSATGDLNLGVGFFNGHQRQGHQGKGKQVDDWFKAYWKNYGTLKHRDPNHRFDNPIKHGGTAAAKNRRNNEGQMHENFFEEGSQGCDTAFVEAFEKSINKQAEQW